MSAAPKRSPHLVGRMPFYAYPRAKFVEMIEPLTWGIRTLPDAQLEIELDQLVETCGGAGHHLADRLMLRLYQQETARRADHLQGFDADLELALTRLATKTNDHDRQLVSDIGRKLFAAGGREAMRQAAQRMLEGIDPAKRALRQHVIEKRWAGIGGDT